MSPVAKYFKSCAHSVFDITVIVISAETKSVLTCLPAVQAKLTAVQTAHHDAQAKLNQPIQQLQGEKKNMTRKMEGLGSQLQQGLFCRLLEQ